MKKALTDVALKSEYRRALTEAKATDSPRRCAREEGMFLLVQPSGKAVWYMRFSLPGRTASGKRKTADISLDVTYGDGSLKRARARREEQKRLREGNRTTDLRVVKKAQQEVASEQDTLMAFATKCINDSGVSKKTKDANLKRLEKFVFPSLGSKRMQEIDGTHVYAVLYAIPHGDDNHLAETVRRIRALLDRIWQRAMVLGLAKFNAASGMQGLLKAPTENGFAAIVQPARFGQLLRDIEAYEGQPVVRCALKLVALTALRSSELRNGTWEEIENLDGEAPRWRVPAHRMKQKVQHFVPLSLQSVAILKELQNYSGPKPHLIFPGIRSRSRPISENTLNAALRSLGYKSDVHVTHGFRKSFSTLLNEHGYDSRLVELQLAHASKNKVAATYDLSSRLVERDDMMVFWSDLCDRLRAGITAVKPVTLKRRPEPA